MRAAAADFRTARILGVRANRVISFSFLVSGVLAAAVSVLLTVQDAARDARLRRLDHDLRPDRRRRRRARPAARAPRSAASRSASRTRSSAPGCPTSSSVYLPVGDLRPRDHRAAPAPGRPLRAAGAARWSACERPSSQLARRRSAPDRRRSRLVGSTVSAGAPARVRDALVSTAIVVALYVFIGNSGVISFGHMSFVAVGAFLSGILTIGARAEELRAAEPVPDPPRTRTSARRCRSCSPRSPAASTRCSSASR